MNAVFWIRPDWNLALCVNPACKSSNTNCNTYIKYGLRWIETSSHRWGPGSRWHHLLAYYITPTNRSNAFLRFVKTRNLKKKTGKSQFWKEHYPIISMFRFYENLKKMHRIIWLVCHRKPEGDPILSPDLISGSWT